MSSPVGRDASSPGCEGVLGLTRPGCLGQAAQPPSCVIGVDAVRRALRDIDFDAGIDRAAARVSSWLDRFGGGPEGRWETSCVPRQPYSS